MKPSVCESLIRRTANHFGIDIKRHRIEASAPGRLSTMLANHGVNVVLDVGANTGQFAQALRAAGYSGKLVSFEPLSSAHSILVRASKFDPHWEVAPRVAIGAHDGEIDLHISNNSVSSSVLEMLDSHTSAAHGSAYTGNERVNLATLDSAARNHLNTETVAFLKIDTQGYEDRVLDGAKELLDRICGLQLELSFIPLYEGQQLFDSLVKRLNALGFTIWAVWPGFCDPHSGRMLQVDVTFFRD